MKIVFGSDHAGYELKTILIEYVKEKGYETYDVGVDSPERADYPRYAYLAGKELQAGNCDLAILCCGTGVGISIAANKVKGVRCCCCSEPFSAAMARRHNNANALAMGGRVVGSELAKMIVDEFLAAKFEGGRHARRVNLINEIEEKE